MHRLVSIVVSHYCEKVRWALDRLGEPYVEEGHLPLLHWRRSFGAGGGRTVPVLVADDGQVLQDSTDVLLWLDKRHPDAGLYAPDRAAILALEDQLDEKLGPATRRWAYFHLLPHRSLLVEVASQGVPRSEVLILQAAFPVARVILRRGLKIDAAGEERSRERIFQQFADVSARLADGRPYLAGDTLTAADLTFAALAAPALLPDGHPTRWPALDRLPEAMRTTVEQLRATPAGRHVLHLYAGQRQARPFA